MKEIEKILELWHYETISTQDIKDMAKALHKAGYRLIPEKFEVLSEKRVKAIITKAYKDMGCSSYKPIIDMRVMRKVLEAQLREGK